MSHELLIAAGHATESPVRLLDSEHAAQLVPGHVDRRTEANSFAVVTVVRTSPTGGDQGTVVKRGETIIGAVALSSPSLTTAMSNSASCGVGSEAGHAVVIAEPDGTVIVRNDGAGVVPIYWCASKQRLHASTHLASLVSLGASASPDVQGLFEYLAMLHPLDQRTTLSEVSLLPAGGELRWRPGQSAAVNSQPLFTPLDEPMSDDDAVQAFEDLWARVIADIKDRAEKRRLSVSLSGGLDSRAIAAAINSYEWQPICFTYGTRRQTEVRVATEVAERLGLPHLALPLTDDRVLRDIHATAAKLDGSHTPVELYDAWFQSSIRNFADVVVNGHAGGPLWGDEKAHGIVKVADISAHVWSRYSGMCGQISGYLAADIKDEAGPAVRSSIRTSLEPWDFTARADMITFWQVSNRQTRWGNMLISAMRRSGVPVETPFMDSRFLRFASRVSPSQRRNGNLYLRIHREVFPKTAGIGRSDDGNPPSRLTHLYWTGDASFGGQWLRMTAEHPVSGARRGVRRASMRAASLARSHLGMSTPADRLEMRNSVFPADLLARTSPAYAKRLADWIDSFDEVHKIFDNEALFAAANALRAGRFKGAVAPLARIATANAWLADYAARELARPAR